MVATVLDPRTALVLIDLQRGIVDSYPSDEVVARSAELARAFRERGLPVVLVRVDFAADLADLPPGRTEAAVPSAAFPDGWAEYVDEVGPYATDIQITKRQWGAFHGTELDLQLRRRGVTGILLAGIATSIGVESTARAAHEHGYHVTVAVDAVADSDRDAHDNSIRKIFPRLGETDTTANLLRLLGVSAGNPDKSAAGAGSRSV